MFHILIITAIALGLMTGGNVNAPVGPVGPVLDQPAGQAQVAGRCPLIYAPVTCDNGKTYPNQCVADQHHAKNCVPSGGL